MNAPSPRGSLFALLLIVAGALLFLDNLGVLPVHNLGAYWPLALVVWGVATLEHRRGANAIIWASTLIAAGVFLVLGNLNILHVTAGVIWPLILIALGATMLVGRVEWPDVPWPPMPNQWGSRTRQASFFGNRLSESVVFSNAKRRVESGNFEGGKLDAVFGGIVMDLTGATISTPDRRVDIEANAVFSGIELLIPRTWRVERAGAAVFGAFEDKTVPPRPEPGFDPPVLVIRGDAVFGAIVVRN